MPHSVQAAFLEAEAAQASYLIVRGTLDFDRGALPQVDYDRQQDTPPLTRVPARLAARALSDGSFDLPIEREVMLEIACYGPWCAQVPKGSEVLAFLELRGTGDDVIATNPCGGYLFGTPTPKMIRDVKRCARGDECVPVR